MLASRVYGFCSTAGAPTALCKIRGLIMVSCSAGPRIAIVVTDGANSPDIKKDERDSKMKALAKTMKEQGIYIVGVFVENTSTSGKDELKSIVSEGLYFESSGFEEVEEQLLNSLGTCLLYTSPSPRDRTRSRMPSSA